MRWRIISSATSATGASRSQNPRRSAEEFLELLRGYSHLKMLLGIEKAPSARDIEARIDSAVKHVLG